jgi:hypothetical protein
MCVLRIFKHMQLNITNYLRMSGKYFIETVGDIIAFPEKIFKDKVEWHM